MIVEALAIYGGLSLLDDIYTIDTKKTTFLREDWTDKAGIKWSIEELINKTPKERVFLFGYDPILNFVKYYELRF